MSSDNLALKNVTHIREYFSSAASNILLIASGKGGVGKTWFTITLAQSLAQMNKKTLVFDGDLGLANIDIQLGLTPDHDLTGVIEGQLDFQDAIFHYTPGNFDILAGRSGRGTLANINPVRLALIREELKKTAKKYDWLLIDLGAGIGGTVQSLVPTAGHCALVITDEPTSLTDAYTFLKITRRNRPDLAMHIIVNQAENIQQGQKTYEGFSQVCNRFLSYTPSLGGIIHRDSNVKETIRYQTLMSHHFPESPALKDVIKISRSLKLDQPVKMSP